MTTLRDLVGRQERVVFVEESATVREAAKAMATANVGCTAVVEGNRLVGLFTERDVLKRVLLRDKSTDQTKVGDVMTRDVIVANADQDVRMGRMLMREHHIRHLPVLDGKEELIGVLSIRDLIMDEMDEIKRYLHLEEG